MRDYDIESDLKQEKFQSIKLVQGDRGNKIKINVYEDGQPVNLAGCSVTAKYKRADGEVVDGTVENKTDNYFYAVMDNNITKVAGTLKMLFNIENGDVKVSTFLLLADIREGIGENTGSSGGDTEVTVDLKDYQKKTDNGLETKNKYIVGAINEVNSQCKDIANLINENYFILKSPNGTQYKIKVNNSGTLQVTGIIDEKLEGLIDNRILVWHDEFDGNTLNLDNWNYELGVVRHNEPQYYRRENVIVKDGNLILKAKREDFKDRSWTSGSIHTNNKAEFRNGRFEAKMKLSSNTSSFPAFWLYGAIENEVYTDEDGSLVGIPGCHFPRCGEIDIIEHMNDYVQVGAYYNTTWEITDDHENDYLATSQIRKSDSTIDFTQYHIFALEKTQTELKYYIDDNLLLEVPIDEAKKIFKEPYFIILDHALKNVNSIDTSVNTIDVLVDWVRVYAPIEDTVEILADSIKINEGNVSLNINEMLLLTTTFTPENTQNQTLVWESTNNSVATVEGGCIRAKKYGTCKAKVTTANKKTDEITITVKTVAVTNLTLNKNSVDLDINSKVNRVNLLEGYKDYTTYSDILSANKATDGFPEGTYVDKKHNQGTVPSGITTDYIPIENIKYICEIDKSNTTLTKAWWQNACLYDSDKNYLQKQSATNVTQEKFVFDNTILNAHYVRFTMQYDKSSTGDYPLKMYRLNYYYTTDAIEFLPEKTHASSNYKIDTSGNVISGKNNVSYLYAVDYPNTITYSGSTWMSIWCYDNKGNYLGNSGETAESTGSSFQLLENTAFIRISQGNNTYPTISFSNSVTTNNANVSADICVLRATIKPENATNQSITWTSDNENIELIPNGLSCTVKANVIGNSVITCTSQDTTNRTISDACTVTVN